MRESPQPQRPQAPAAPVLNADPEKAAHPAGHSDGTGMRSIKNDMEPEPVSKRQPRRSASVNMPLSARTSETSRPTDDLTSSSSVRKKSRLQHALTDAQHLRSRDTDTMTLDVTTQTQALPRTNLEHIYSQMAVAEPDFKAPAFLSSDDLLLARKATQLTIANIRATSVEPLIQERLVNALSCELSHSVANPLKRMEKDARCYYAFGKIVGKGTFGRVYNAQHRLSGTQVAIKSYFRESGAAVCCRPPISQIHGSSSRTASRQQQSRPPVSKHPNEGDINSDALDWKRVRQEVKMMSALKPHPSIIQFVEAFETPTQMHVVMEFVKGETLCDYMRRASPSSLRLSERKARMIFTQVCDAVSSLHDQNVIHRDLKLENMLLDKRGRAKVIDFGFSQFDYSSGSGSRSNSGSTSGSDATAKNFCGTPSYMAPEVVSCKSYDGKRADVWSLGVVLYVLLCGKFPFQGQSFHQLYQSIRSSSASSQFPFPPGLSKDAQSLVRSVLVVDPTKRPRVRDILTHPWILRTGAVTKGGGEPSETREMEARTNASGGTIGGDQRFFFAFLQWEEAQALFCEALEQIYGLSGSEVKTVLQDKRRNGVTAFVRLMLLTAEKKYVMLADALAHTGNDNNNNNNSVESTEPPGSAIDATTTGASHKQHLEKLIGLTSTAPPTYERITGLRDCEQTEHCDPDDTNHVDTHNHVRGFGGHIVLHSLELLLAAWHHLGHEAERQQRDCGREHRELPDAVEVTLFEIRELHGPELQQHIRERVRERVRDVRHAREQRERHTFLVLRTHAHEDDGERQVLEALSEPDDRDIPHGEPERRDAQRVVHLEHEQNVEQRERGDDDARDEVEVLPRVLDLPHDARAVDEDRGERDARADRGQRAVLERVEVVRDFQVVAPGRVVHEQRAGEREEAHGLPRRTPLEHHVQLGELLADGHHTGSQNARLVHDPDARDRGEQREHGEQSEELAHGEPDAPVAGVGDQRADPVADHLADKAAHVHDRLHLTRIRLQLAQHAVGDERVAHDVRHDDTHRRAEQQQRERCNGERVAVRAQQIVEERARETSKQQVGLEAQPSDRNRIGEHAEEDFESPGQRPHDRDGAQLRVTGAERPGEEVDVRRRQREEQPRVDVRDGDRDGLRRLERAVTRRRGVEGLEVFVLMSSW